MRDALQGCTRILHMWAVPSNAPGQRTSFIVTWKFKVKGLLSSSCQVINSL